MSFEKNYLRWLNKHSGIKFSFYYGYIIEFDKANLDGITPHILILAKMEKNWLFYTMTYIIKLITCYSSWRKVYVVWKKYIRNYFKNDSNINVKSNNK